MKHRWTWTAGAARLDGAGLSAGKVSALTDRNVLVLVSVAMIAFGSVIGLLRDRHAHLLPRSVCAEDVSL
jgi:hypothetical protein